MDKQPFKDLCSILHSLNEAQVQEVLVRLKGLGKIEATDVAQVKGSDDWLIRGLCLALINHGLLSKASQLTLMRSRAFTTYSKSAPVIMGDLQKLLPTKNATQAKLTLGLLVGNALIGWCKLRFKSVSAGLVLNNTSRSLEALEKCFPGYIEANLFHLVLDSKARGTQ